MQEFSLERISEKIHYGKKKGTFKKYCPHTTTVITGPLSLCFGQLQYATSFTNFKI